MKVILKEDVETLGKCGEVIEVKAGYGRNYLLPRNLAITASKGNLRAIEELRSQQQLRQVKVRRAAETIKTRLEKASCTAEVHVGEEDKVFGSVTAQAISDLLAAQGIEIDRKKIILEEPLKALGVYTIPVKVASEVTANLKVWVVKKAE
jgi:large subunit ribosomal protein L9